jgi:hypothetical protein
MEEQCDVLERGPSRALIGPAEAPDRSPGLQHRDQRRDRDQRPREDRRRRRMPWQRRARGEHRRPRREEGAEVAAHEQGELGRKGICSPQCNRL